jgi:hypothetical protein
LSIAYLAVNSSKLSSWLWEASWPSLSAASFALVLKLEPARALGNLEAGRERTGRAVVDRKKVERAARRRIDVDDIRKVEDGMLLRLAWSWGESGLKVLVLR